MEALALRITHRGVLVDHAALTKLLGARLGSLLEQLTIREVIVSGKRATTKESRLYRYYDTPRGRYLAVARFAKLGTLLESLYGIASQYQIALTLPVAPPPSAFLVQLDPNQSAVVQYLEREIYSEERLGRGAASTILVMDTGLGKTYVAAALLERWRARGCQKTLIVLPNSNNVAGWLSCFARYLPHLKVARYDADHKEDGEVVIMLIQSAIADSFLTNEKMSERDAKQRGATNEPRSEHGTKYRGATNEPKASEKASESGTLYFARFQGVIYDEIHNYAAPSWQEVFWRTSFPFMLGLTATPDERADGMDKVYQMHVGKLTIAKELPGFNAAQIEWKGEVWAIHYYGPPSHTRALHNKKTGMISVAAMQQQLARDPHRMRLLCDYMTILHSQGRNVFVFAEQRSFLLQLQSAYQAHYLQVKAQPFNPFDVGAAPMRDGENLNYLTGQQGEGDWRCEAAQSDERVEDERGRVEDEGERGEKQGEGEEEMISVLMGGMKDNEKAAAQLGQIILITYGYGKESLSIPRMDAIIFATPRRSKMVQTLGRILRRSGDPSIKRVIVDIIDSRTSLSRQFSDRRAAYEEKRFPITIKKVRYENLQPLTLPDL